MTNLGRLVKWQDANGGWHTGREVIKPGGRAVLHAEEIDDYALNWYGLVQESCTYQLSWVLYTLLQPQEAREQRSERGEE